MVAKPASTENCFLLPNTLTLSEISRATGFLAYLTIVREPATDFFGDIHVVVVCFAVCFVYAGDGREDRQSVNGTTRVIGNCGIEGLDAVMKSATIRPESELWMLIGTVAAYVVVL